MAMAGMPVSSVSQRDSSAISAIAPGTVESGCSGCTSPKPGSRAIFSLRRGLCFMVHQLAEPRRELPRLLQVHARRVRAPDLEDQRLLDGQAPVAAERLGLPR